MAPTAPTASSSSRSKPLPKRSEAATPVPSAAAGRVTRLRAAKESTTGPGTSSGGLTRMAPPPPPRAPGFLAKGKEGLRKVSGKIGQKEKENQPIKKPNVQEHNDYSESLQAYLRIRPSPADSEGHTSARPYLEIQSETDVLMRAPSDSSRHHIPKPPHIYSFDKVFPPTTPQSGFFTTTTLPLVEKLLQGENGLLFAYGVSNSGKSYTIQGGSTHSAIDRGVLPRSIDVVFNSIEGLKSNANLKPQGLADVVLSDEQDDPIVLNDPLAAGEPRIEDTVKVDRNFSYAVFVSYAEVYNEKIFDLLDSVLPTAPSTPSMARSRATNTGLPRASNTYGFPGALNSSFNLAAMANGGGGILKRHALSLKNDPEGNGKYIAGLKDVRVRSREEALAVFRSGESARQVFGTIANRESSRSHGIFTIKVVRIHNGAPEDPDSAQVSRLAIVDLAGSERTRNTQTTGDRLKEAGNINKSLMVLGQCLEVLRSNQQKMSSNNTAVSTKKKLAVVPFRHSKLTEVFQNFFVGDGRAVIIVNVNPYDTGFDENSHVMRFSAIAREIQTTASNKVGSSGFPLLKRQISTQFSALRNAVSGHGHGHGQGPMKIKVTVPVLPKPDDKDLEKGGKKLAMDRESQGFVMVEEELEVVEESESESDEEDDKDALVEYLFEQLREMKTRLYESEMRNASVEVEVREEVAKEMQESLQRMHDDFSKQLSEQVAANELKTDRKIDIVTRTMTPAVHRIAQYQPQHGSAASSRISEDVSMEDPDESFESAIDASLMTSGDDSVMTEGSDPFVVRSPGLPQITLTRDSFNPVVLPGSPSPAQLQNSNDQGNISAAADTSIEANTTVDEEEEEGNEITKEEIDLDSEVDDDDSEAIKPVAIVISSDEESVEETDEDEEEEEEEESEEEEDADEEEVDSDESAFTLSDEDVNEEDSDDSEGSSPVRKASSRRRTTGSPKKPSSPIKKASKATPAKVKSTPAKRTPAKARKDEVAGTPPSKAQTEPLTPGPLSERISQIQLSEDEDEVPIKTTMKKKRTLGKKIVTEDEMIQADRVRMSVGGAEVRRMLRG
ncbi:hypothetical protein I302_107883 [Kwoniella bestiolae CBS 10118]|uniref:Kinesin family member 20/23 n=1 Tax=Kwoniella bestiolae CBS 10118 TaxID=1296100 RepID=A0A1B9FXA3_9TREE|nr:kinesin family member 20/23 [Kwoniella bestiolae CBS 10118]OCF23394.1 kinesin family member 20/23 [Kwoniella bestiolae CBS 10118]